MVRRRHRTKIESYLFFGDNCEEALAFTSTAWAAITALMRYEGSPMDNAQLPKEWKQKVMHSTFESQGARFMASETAATHGARCFFPTRLWDFRRLTGSAPSRHSAA